GADQRAVVRARTRAGAAHADNACVPLARPGRRRRTPLDAAHQGARPRAGPRVGAARDRLTARAGYHWRDAFARVHVPNPALAGVPEAPALSCAAKYDPRS